MTPTAPASVSAPDPGSLESVDGAAFRQGMALLAGAVNVVTTQGPQGPAGFTATAVCSVTADPPTLLVCLNTTSSAALAFDGAEVLAVNTLTPAQAGVAQAFGGKTPMADRFAGADWRPGRTGAPVLQGALVAFEARIEHAHRVGTHQVLFARIVAVHAGDPAQGASVYWNRAFHALPQG
jgi:flavin reductase